MGESSAERAPAQNDGWQEDVETLWQQGQRQQAVDLLLSRINASGPRWPRLMGLQFVYYLWNLGDLQAAERVLCDLKAAHPDDPEVVENLAVMLSRQGRHAEATPLFERATQLRPESANAWDGLAAGYKALGDHDRARQAGERSLALKDAAAKPLQGWQCPAISPAAHLASRPAHHVIAFSLWGSNPRYLRGALRNLLLIPDLYPGWRARFYVDATVPQGFLSTAPQLGAELRLMPAGQSLRQRLCWRFLVANDPGVGRFLVRDCDSVVSLRECRAVDAWLASGRWFHVMRDWWTHTDPMLAGMWGGIAGVLPDLEPLMQHYKPAAKETANVDQWFLRDVIWGSVREHALIHDRCFRSAASQPWPAPDPEGNFHVGQDEFAANPRRQATMLQGWIASHAWLQLEGEGAWGNLPSPKLAVAPLPAERKAIWRRYAAGAATSRTEPPVQGLYINLAEATERNRSMQAQLKAAGLAGSHHRFEACGATTEEALQRGLRSAGELGLWRSQLGALHQLIGAASSPDAVLHILEDDAVLHPALPDWIRRLQEGEACWDVLFSDSFLTAELYRKMLALLQEERRAGEVMVLQGGWYLGCTASYLMPVSGAQKLLSLLEEQFQRATLEPIDMAMRRLIREGRLRAGVTLPFLSTVALESRSFVQGEGRGARVRRAQHLDLFLRRLLYLGTLEGDVQAEFSRLQASFAAHFSASELLELSGMMLEAGHLRGFLANY